MATSNYKRYSAGHLLRCDSRPSRSCTSVHSRLGHQIDASYLLPQNTFYFTGKAKNRVALHLARSDTTTSYNRGHRIDTCSRRFPCNPRIKPKSVIRLWGEAFIPKNYNAPEYSPPSSQKETHATNRNAGFAFEISSKNRGIHKIQASTLLLDPVIATQHIDNLVLVQFTQAIASRPQVLARVELGRLGSQHLANRRRHGQTAVAVDIDLADRR